MTMASLPWREWCPEAFEEAEREELLVLLLLVVPWCRFCHDLEDRVLGDEKVLQAVLSGWLPLRVDADKRLDMHEP